MKNIKYAEIPHEIHNLTPMQSLDAMPAIRSKPIACHAVDRLNHALEDSRNLPSAYETLAVFGEMERTKSGYKCIDPRTARIRCERVRTTLLPYTL